METLNGIDSINIRSGGPRAARLSLAGKRCDYMTFSGLSDCTLPPRYLFCVIGTAYGYLHTSGGDIRTWKTASGARKAAARYIAIHGKD